MPPNSPNMVRSAMRIDPLTPADNARIEALLDEAFGTDRRARTAYALRAGTMPIASLSFAARADNGTLIGSLQCWPIELVTDTRRAYPLALLGPVAVAVNHRSEGVGKALIGACLAGAPNAAMLLIGDAPYYGRFGFSSAATRTWALPGPVDPERLLARNADILPAQGVIAPASLARKAA